MTLVQKNQKIEHFFCHDVIDIPQSITRLYIQFDTYYGKQQPYL